MAVRRRRKHVALIGLGNIGSHVLGFLARMEEVTHVTLIDPDVYEANNLRSQGIDPADVGQPKAKVQARRMRRLRPELHVRPLVARVEDVPPGLLRADVVLAALDSRAARRHVNELAWRWTTPWLDSGVDAAGLLARVNVYTASPEAPCLECAWEQADYDALEQRYLCQPGKGSVTATNAPAELGALAASLMALECRKLLRDGDTCLHGRQVLIDALHHKHYVTAFRRNPDCRFDHEGWNEESMESVLADWTLGQLQSWAETEKRIVNGFVSCAGRHWASRLACTGCGREFREMLCLTDPLPSQLRICACGGEMAATGFDMQEELAFQNLTAEQLALPLAESGMRPGDVITVSAGGADVRAVIRRRRDRDEMSIAIAAAERGA